MNYTPQRADGSIDISKALQVNVEFDLSRQFLVFPCEEGIDQGSPIVHLPCSPHELREGRRRRFRRFGFAPEARRASTAADPTHPSI
jgi:hypothetical protein